MGQEDELRHRLVVVELGEERPEHLRHVEIPVGAGEVGAVAPVLAGAEEEDLDAGGAALLVGGEDVGFLEGVRIDPLVRLDMRQRRQPVAVDRRRLEIEALGRRFHLGLDLGADGAAPPGEKRLRLVDQMAVVALARSRRCTAPSSA